jgi:hypothetical protein
MMTAVGLILGHMINDDFCPCLPDLVTDGGLELQLTAGPEAELDAIAYGTGNPPILSHPGNGRKAHAGGTADDLQDGRHGLDAVDGGKIRLKVSRHV